MAADRPASPPPRARPCGDLPLERLLERAEELTRRWAIALIAARPVEGLGSLGLAELAGDGPALCRGLLHALCADGELALLVDGDTGHGAGERQPGRGRPAPAQLATIAGAGDGRTLSEAVEALRGAAWELLLEEVSGPLAFSPRALAEVGDRLAYVCSRLLGEALAGVALGAEPGRQESAASPGFPVRPVRSARAPGGVVILDERVEAEAERAPESPSGTEPGAADPGGRARGAAFDAPELSARRLATVPAALSEDVGAIPALGGGPEIEIRDERHEEGPAAWIGSIGRQLERFRSDGRPFAVLLVESLAPEPRHRERVEEGLAPSLPRLERTLADELARATGGRLTRERPGRCWLIAPGTDRIAAAQLRERLELALAGERVAIAVGIAVCPEDGESAPALAAHADIGLYAARAEARAAASRIAGDGGGER